MGFESVWKDLKGFLLGFTEFLFCPDGKWLPLMEWGGEWKWCADAAMSRGRWSFCFCISFLFFFFLTLKRNPKKKYSVNTTERKRNDTTAARFPFPFNANVTTTKKKHRGRRGRIGNSVKIKKTNKKKRVLYHLVVEVGAMIDDRRDSPPSLTLNLLLLVHFCFLNFYFVFFFLRRAPVKKNLGQIERKWKISSIFCFRWLCRADNAS